MAILLYLDLLYHSGKNRITYVGLVLSIFKPLHAYSLII